jgi:tetrahydromethanopterin S-methyltransferase, subunit F (EC 2.1.1.86)
MAEEAKPAATGAIRMAAINVMVESIRYKGQILARSNKFESSIMGSGLMGFIIGILLAAIMILVPVVLVR